MNAMSKSRGCATIMSMACCPFAASSTSTFNDTRILDRMKRFVSLSSTTRAFSKQRKETEGRKVRNGQRREENRKEEEETTLILADWAAQSATACSDSLSTDNSEEKNTFASSALNGSARTEKGSRRNQKQRKQNRKRKQEKLAPTSEREGASMTNTSLHCERSIHRFSQFLAQT